MMMVSVRHQCSQPYSKTGNTHVSTTDLPAIGERAPWNAPMDPEAKKARLALRMFCSTIFEALRLCVQVYPRHFASRNWEGGVSYQGERDSCLSCNTELHISMD